MTRQLVTIDEDKCTGCGQCVAACHEGALALINGKAKLVREDYCDGLGACIGECPAGAISLRTVEVPMDHGIQTGSLTGDAGHVHACPFSAPRSLAPQPHGSDAEEPAHLGLRNWPTQLALVPAQASWLQGADLLITADCVPTSSPEFHRTLVLGHVVVQACPKLDNIAAHTEKLTSIFALNELRSVTVARMEVPCCGRLVQAVRQALAASGKELPLRVVTVGVDGRIVSTESAAPALAGN